MVKVCEITSNINNVKLITVLFLPVKWHMGIKWKYKEAVQNQKKRIIKPRNPLATGQCKWQKLTKTQDATEQYQGRRIHLGLLNVQKAHWLRKPLSCKLLDAERLIVKYHYSCTSSPYHLLLYTRGSMTLGWTLSLTLYGSSYILILNAFTGYPSI